MAKPYWGTQIVAVRVPASLLALIDADVQRSIQHDCEPRSTRTTWILSAIQDVFRHRGRAQLARERRRARRRLKVAAGEPSALDQAVSEPQE